jgi:hypothetical protein
MTVMFETIEDLREHLKFKEPTLLILLPFYAPFVCITLSGKSSIVF